MDYFVLDQCLWKSYIDKNRCPAHGITNILKTLLQDDVPVYSGKRAKEIVSKELGKPCGQVFKDFSQEPVAAASLGQVHTTNYLQGKEGGNQVQRAGLKELFDVDGLEELENVGRIIGQVRT